jgi:hypothetical protein
LFGGAAEFPSLKRVFAFDFDVSYYDGEHLLWTSIPAIR